MLDVRYEAIRYEMGKCAKSIIKIGLHLINVKRECGHGIFLKWLAAEFGWSDQTARRFMHVADRFGDQANSTRVLNLEPTTLYLLAAPKTPDAVREDVLNRFDAGEKLSVEEVRNLVRQSNGDAEKPSVLDRIKTLIMKSLSSEEREQLMRWLGFDPTPVTEEPSHVESDAEQSPPVKSMLDASCEPETTTTGASEPTVISQLAASEHAEPEQSLLDLDRATLQKFRDWAPVSGPPWIGIILREKMDIDEDAVDRLVAAGYLVPSPANPHSFGIRQPEVAAAV